MATDPLLWWRGPDGDRWHTRSALGPTARAASFGRLTAGRNIRSVLEIGCGPGWNLTALKSLFPTATLTGVEPNAVARQKAVAAGLTVVDGALPSPLPAGTFDLVLCCNVLGHLIPAQLDAGLTAVRGKVATNRWLLVIEYNTERADRADEACEWPTAGVVDVLWRRDFGAHFGRLYPSRTVLATGMVYKAADAMPDASTFWMMRF